MTPLARRAAFLLCLGLLAACGQEPAPDPSGPAAGRSAARSAVDRVILTAPADQAAQAPFGMLRVAPVMSPAVDAESLQALRHARGDGTAPDLWFRPLQAGGAAWVVERVVASPGHLQVRTAGGGPRIEATGTRRVALYRIAELPNEGLTIRLQWRGGGQAHMAFVPARGRRAVTGSLRRPDGVELHLALRFDASFTVQAPGPDGALDLHFPVGEGVVRARLALSTVDVAAARANLGELEHWEFERALGAVQRRWNGLLQRVSISGMEPERAVLTTALYRTLAHYGDITDRDGRFRAGADSIRRAPPGAMHVGNLDLAREAPALIPLLTLVTPERANDLVDGLMAHQQAYGRFPVRTSWGREQGGPALAPALPVLAALAARSPAPTDFARVLPAMMRDASVTDDGVDWSDYQRLGYFPFDQPQAVSRSLQAARAHHAVAAVAAALGEREVAAAFATRTLFYRQLFDHDSGWFRGRDRQRAWRTRDARGGLSSAAAADYAHGDPWQALWAPALFDIDGLLTLLGGRQVLAARLDAYFDPSSGGRYDPSRPALHHVPWLYAVSNDPARTDGAVSRILSERASGQGEDACAAAWRVFATLGLYPAYPARGDYVLAWPSVANARLDTGAGEVLIDAPGAGSGDTLATASFDGVPLPGRTVSHARLVGGGVLALVADADQTEAGVGENRGR